MSDEDLNRGKRKVSTEWPDGKSVLTFMAPVFRLRAQTLARIRQDPFNTS